MDIKKEFLKIYTELEFNAKKDTLFERMTLKRLQDFSDMFFGTNLGVLKNNECQLWREIGSIIGEEEMRNIIRAKRIREFGLG